MSALLFTGKESSILYFELEHSNFNVVGGSC